MMAMTDEELVRYTILKSKLTPLEVELVHRLEDRVYDEYEFPQWAIELIAEDETAPGFLKYMIK